MNFAAMRTCDGEEQGNWTQKITELHTAPSTEPTQQQAQLWQWQQVANLGRTQPYTVRIEIVS